MSATEEVMPSDFVGPCTEFCIDDNGDWEQCGQAAIAFRFDSSYGGSYPVCAEHNVPTMSVAAEKAYATGLAVRAMSA